MPFCRRCGTELDRARDRCPMCGKTEEKYPLYAKAFRAKRTVYVVQKML